MASDPIVVSDENNNTLELNQIKNLKMKGRPVLHINATKTDEERLKIALQTNSFCEAEPSKKAFHMNWNLRPRIHEKELGNASLTMNKHIQIDKLLNQLKLETGNYFTRNASLGTTITSCSNKHSAEEGELASAVGRLKLERKLRM